jgi:hypothetical protein
LVLTSRQAIDVTEYALSVVKMMSLLETQGYPLEDSAIKDVAELTHKYLATNVIND